MPSRNISFVPGEYYHIYNRGNSKQKIFRDKEDYERFVKYLYLHNSKKNVVFRDDIVEQSLDAFAFDRGDQLVSIGAWVLMPNHFHIYLSFSHMSDIWEDGTKNNITEFMRKLSTSYVKYFNAKYERTGGLFEGAFKAIHINKDNQAKYLFSYIHLNPVKLIQKDWKERGIKDKRRAVEFLNQYAWSSYKDYAGEQRTEGLILNREDFLNYFPKISDFKKEIIEWLQLSHMSDI
jgi:putative transposase